MLNIKDVIKSEQPAINGALEQSIAELPAQSRPVARHIFLAGGKRLRPLLVLYTGRLFGCRENSLYTIAAAVEMIHAATLLHDDIMDNAPLRRGQAAAHTLFPLSHVILAGDAMLSKALMMVANLGSTALTGCLSEAVLRTAEGQITELSNIRNPHLSYNAYMEIITGKTAWILKTACEMGAIHAGATPKEVSAMATFGMELGLAFQLVDDALDFAPCEETGKPSGGDVLEGKLTPPVYFYIESLELQKAEEFRTKFSNGDFDEATLKSISAEIQANGCCHKTRELAKIHIEKAKQALQYVPNSPEREVLGFLAEYIKTRSS